MYIDNCIYTVVLEYYAETNNQIM